MPVSEDIGLIGHAESPVALSPGVFKSVAQDALDPLAGIDIFLDGHLIGGALLEISAHTHVEPLGVFTENNEVNVALVAASQGRQAFVEEFDRAKIDVEIELETHSEEDISGVLHGRDARVAEGADKDGITFPAQCLKGAGGEADAVAKITLRSPIKMNQLEVLAANPRHRFENLDRFSRDVHADAVSGDNRNAPLGRIAGHSIC